MNIIINRFKEFFSLWRNYSFTLAFYNIVWWFCFYTHIPFCYKISTLAINKKTEWFNRYFNKYYKDIIEKHKQEAIVTKSEQQNIWVFWGQGEGNMPLLVKACYRQLKHYNNNVQLVTIDNVKDYIELPRIIYEKAHLGNISWANFSDIVRNTLLARYGGFWIDATVWVRGEIPLNNLSKLDFFSANGAVPATSRSVRFWTSFEHNWSTWCMWSRNKNNKLFSFVSEMMISIAVREKQWPDYVIQDYLIYYAYKNIPGIEEMLAQSTAIPCRNRNKLAEMMNDKFDEKRYKELVENDFVFKLSYRAKWKKETAEGAQTFYGRILNGVI